MLGAPCAAMLLVLVFVRQPRPPQAEALPLIGHSIVQPIDASDEAETTGASIGTDEP